MATKATLKRSTSSTNSTRPVAAKRLPETENPTKPSLTLVPPPVVKSYYVQIVTEYAPPQAVALKSASMAKARKEALSFLDDVRVGQGWVELYEQNGAPTGAPLLVWVGVA